MTVEPERVDHMGVVLEIDHAVMAPRIVESIKRGAYERAEARIVKTLIKDDDVVLELGAGVGFVTTVIATDPRVAKLVSYEPDAQLAAATRKTLLLNGVAIEGKVEIRNAVVSNSIATPTTMFHVHNEFWMSGLQPYNTVARIDEVRVDRLNEV